MIEIVSPLTGTKNVKKISAIDVSKLRESWVEAFSIDIQIELESCSEIELYKCNETGLRFFIPLSAAGSDNLYAQLQRFDWFYMPWKWEHETLLSRIKKSERILEVGCATGGFVERLHKSGFGIEGIEFNTEAVRECQRKGLPVTAMRLDELSNTEVESYDVVCSFQVLEHVPDPYSFIKNSLMLLKSAGRLIICVPNNDSFLHYTKPLLDMPPHHMTQWRSEVFLALEKLFPLKLVNVKYEPLAKYHIAGYLQGHQARLYKEKKWFRFLLNRYSFPILRWLLNIGIRRFCRGQSLYVEFLKL